ncbi:hypothetical protein HYW84_03585 [Candidatus Peregrinibacteria bacterium]|nr:hypothetical protein [Candidatus Peregrinibacteria bacterium]
MTKKKKKSADGHIRYSGVVAIALAVALVMQSGFGSMYGSFAMADLFNVKSWLDISRWWQSQGGADGDSRGQEKGPVECRAQYDIPGMCPANGDCPAGKYCNKWGDECECVWNTGDYCPDTWPNAPLLQDDSDPTGCIAGDQLSGLCPEGTKEELGIRCGNSPDERFCHYCRSGSCLDGFECRQTGNNICPDGSQAEVGDPCSDGTCYHCADQECPAGFDRCWIQTGEQPCDSGFPNIGPRCTRNGVAGRCIICPSDGGDRGVSDGTDAGIGQSGQDNADSGNFHGSNGDRTGCDPAIASLNDEQRSALMHPGGATVGTLLHALSQLSGDKTLDQVIQAIGVCGG